ncbi:probable carbohydrate esterase At4g34215 isoform X3 [Pistacia vera]|nr:probable carbohydrate esterase At4g34215 isoform X2 [Pistacia vera]XP_031288108.1 probable carbohydrate esterase At4g34215 isoform X3 [Pistacia vera]
MGPNSVNVISFVYSTNPWTLPSVNHCSHLHHHFLVLQLEFDSPLKKFVKPRQGQPSLHFTTMDSTIPDQIADIPNPTQIFILSGQSNMAGRGGVSKHQHWDGVVPSDCQSHPSILRLSAKLHWELAREPLHADIDTKKVCGVGPGMSFANVVRERVGGENVVGLVPCAVGGTAIREWARGEKLYENMVTRSKESLKSGGEIKCLLWYQGESDTSTQHDADAYQRNMETLIHNVREDLGLPSLPIIQVAIASGDKRYMKKIREAQMGINLPNVVCVDARGLELKEDHLHLTTGAQVKLGHILGEAYFKHFAGSAQSSKC